MSFEPVTNFDTGSGCMAALEAEKYLADHEDLPEEEEKAKHGNL